MQCTAINHPNSLEHMPFNILIFFSCKIHHLEPQRLNIMKWNQVKLSNTQKLLVLYLGHRELWMSCSLSLQSADRRTCHWNFQKKSNVIKVDETKHIITHLRGGVTWRTQS